MCFLFNRMVGLGSFRRIFGFCLGSVSPGGFSFTDGSNVKLVKDEMADITGPDREDVSGRADYDRYGDD